MRMRIHTTVKNHTASQNSIWNSDRTAYNTVYMSVASDRNCLGPQFSWRQHIYYANSNKFQLVDLFVGLPKSAKVFLNAYSRHRRNCCISNSGDCDSNSRQAVMMHRRNVTTRNFISRSLESGNYVCVPEKIRGLAPSVANASKRNFITVFYLMRL